MVKTKKKTTNLVKSVVLISNLKSISLYLASFSLETLLKFKFSRIKVKMLSYLVKEYIKKVVQSFDSFTMAATYDHDAASHTLQRLSTNIGAGVRIDDDCHFFRRVRHLFTREEVESMLSEKTLLQRGATFVDALIRRLDEDTFYTFVNVLIEPLRSHVLKMYTKAGGQVDEMKLTFLSLSLRDDIAIDVISGAMRMKLLTNLHMNEESSFFLNMEYLFSRIERQLIFSKRCPSDRAKTFLDFLSIRLTSKVFTVFLSALDESLRAELIEAYNRASDNQKVVEQLFQCDTCDANHFNDE